MTLLSTFKRKYTEKKGEYGNPEERLDIRKHFPSSVRE
jgi:hypothetical protein